MEMHDIPACRMKFLEILPLPISEFRICFVVSPGCVSNHDMLYTNHIIVQLDELFATKVATFAPFCTPLAVDSYFRPILSPGVPGNVIFDTFNS